MCAQIRFFFHCSRRECPLHTEFRTCIRDKIEESKYDNMWREKKKIKRNRDAHFGCSTAAAAGVWQFFFLSTFACTHISNAIAHFGPVTDCSVIHYYYFKCKYLYVLIPNQRICDQICGWIYVLWFAKQKEQKSSSMLLQSDCRHLNVLRVTNANFRWFTRWLVC